MEVQVVYNEMIKPSSQTLDHLRSYKLSLLDQISPRAHNPFIYFYSLTNPSRHEPDHFATIADKLKKALSYALTLYYPLAGGHKDGQRILDCSDEGALFAIARVNAELSCVLENPIPLELNKLLPLRLDEFSEVPLGVQLNSFDGGGVAVGVCVAHYMADALSSLVFIQSWMAIARGQNEAVVCPEFLSGNLFSSIDMCGYRPFVPITKDMCAMYPTKRFVFQNSTIELLRARYQERTSQEAMKTRFSRIEVLSSFIWNRFVDSTKLAEAGLHAKEYTIAHAVNIRPKFDHPLPNHSFGNYYVTSITAGSIEGTGEEDYQYGLAKKIGEEVRKIDKGLVEYIRANAEKYVESVKKGVCRLEKGEVVGFFFSSLCRFPLYEADFGYGKPTWVSSAARGLKNTVALLDNEKGDGIEAYFCLEPEDMAKLEADEEFLSYVSPNMHA